MKTYLGFIYCTKLFIIIIKKETPKDFSQPSTTAINCKKVRSLCLDTLKLPKHGSKMDAILNSVINMSKEKYDTMARTLAQSPSQFMIPRAA